MNQSSIHGTPFRSALSGQIKIVHDARGAFQSRLRELFLQTACVTFATRFGTRSSLTLTDLHIDAKSRGLTHSFPHVTHVTPAHPSCLQCVHNRFVFVYTRSYSELQRVIILCTKAKRRTGGRRFILISFGCFPALFSYFFSFFVFFFSLYALIRGLSVLIPESAYASCTLCRNERKRDRERRSCV